MRKNSPQLDIVFSGNGHGGVLTSIKLSKYIIAEIMEYVMNKGFASRQRHQLFYSTNASIYAYDEKYLAGFGSDKLFSGRYSAVMMKDTVMLDICSDKISNIWGICVST